jgi:DNA-binding XRE family transcriptional regulator
MGTSLKPSPESFATCKYSGIFCQAFLLYFSCVPKTRLVDALSAQVAQQLKAERQKRGLSLNVLARKAGLARQTVSYVEQEIQSPSLDTLLRIAAVLEMDLEKIIAKARKRANKKIK